MKTILNLSLPICSAVTQSLRGANLFTPGKLFGLTVALAWSCLAATSPAQLSPEWVSRVPVGTSLSSGTAGIYVDPDGVSYITGTSGASGNTNITTVSFAPDGSTRWTQTLSSQGSGADQASGITKGSNGVLYVVGSTPGANFFANVLILAYDAATGTLLNKIRYSSGPGISEFGSSIVADEAGNIYVTGGTVGDGPDVMTLKFNTGGVLQWRQVWDGAAFAPFSLDSPVKILARPERGCACRHHRLCGLKSRRLCCGQICPSQWCGDLGESWGVTGDDFPVDMEIDAAGDVYVTGIGIDFIDKYSTIKLRGSDGQLLWQFYDALGLDHSARGLLSRRRRWRFRHWHERSRWRPLKFQRSVFHCKTQCGHWGAALDECLRPNLYPVLR